MRALGAGEEAQALVPPRLLDFWRFFRSQAAHAARQALSGAPGRLAARPGLAHARRRPSAARLPSPPTARTLPRSSNHHHHTHPPNAVRDLLAWVGFINAAAPQLGVLPAYAHGAHLVLLDGIGLGVGLAAEVRAGGRLCWRGAGRQAGCGARAPGCAAVRLVWGTAGRTGALQAEGSLAQLGSAGACFRGQLVLSALPSPCTPLPLHPARHRRRRRCATAATPSC